MMSLLLFIYFSNELAFLLVSFNTKCIQEALLEDAVLASIEREAAGGGSILKIKEVSGMMPFVSPHCHYSLQPGPSPSGLCSHVEHKVDANKTRLLCALVSVA